MPGPSQPHCRSPRAAPGSPPRLAGSPAAGDHLPAAGGSGGSALSDLLHLEGGEFTELCRGDLQ